MKGTFFITIDYLKQLGARREGQREFQRVFPEGGEYQEILDRCADEGRLDFAEWLFSKIGRTDDVRIFKEGITDTEKTIFFAGGLVSRCHVSVKRIVAGEGIQAGGGIQAGRGIRAGESIQAVGGIHAGWDIRAGWGIEAGDGIQAGGFIKAGEDYCIFAGLRHRKSMWDRYAIVSAAAKPENLCSGFWKEKEAV